MCRLYLAVFQPFRYLLLHVCCFVLTASLTLTALSSLSHYLSVSTVLLYIRYTLWNWSEAVLSFYFPLHLPHVLFGYDLIGKSDSIWHATDCSMGTVLVDGEYNLNLLGICCQDCAELVISWEKCWVAVGIFPLLSCFSHSRFVWEEKIIEPLESL